MLYNSYSLLIPIHAHARQQKHIGGIGQRSTLPLLHLRLPDGGMRTQISETTMPNLSFHRIKNMLQYRRRFVYTFIGMGLIDAILHLSNHWQWSSNLLLSWNIAVLSYLGVSLSSVWHIDHAQILKHAEQQDASKWVILLWVFLSLVMCFIAIVIELAHLPNAPLLKTGHLALSILTIISAWFLMHSIFAIHYAHDYYLADAKGAEGGLEFPKTPHPTYPDFIYFSYVIGTSAQTADVSISSKAMRKLNTLHILLAYGFNTTILAIAINVAAGFIAA